LYYTFPMEEEIYYLIAYNKNTKKFRSADEMLGVFVNSQNGEGSVRVTQDSGNPTWRDLQDGLEKDIDYDNTLLLGAFIKDVNKFKRD
jgi:hypothetical protein